MINAIALLVGLSLLLGGCVSNPRKDHSNVSIDIAPDKKSVVFSAHGTNDWDLFVLDLETKKARLLLSLSGNELSPHVSPDDKKVLFALTTLDYKSSAIHELELATNKVTKIADNGPYYDSDPTYGANTSEIYFNRAHRRRPYSMGGYVWDQWDLYKAVKDKPTRLTQALYYQLYKPSVNATSGDVFFSADKDKKTSINRLDQKGTLSIYRETGSWSATARIAKSVVYINDHNKDFNFEIYLTSGKGNDQKLTNLKSYLKHACMSDDGTLIFFLSELNRDNRVDLYSIQPDGQNLTKIVDSTFFDDPLKI